MAQDIVTTLKVNTGESQKTIKELKDEIKNLKKSLEEATIGSDAFEQASQELTQAQNELKSVLDSTKKSVQDAEGSYNALSKQMSELKKEWKATNDEAKRNQLGEQIDKINNELKELDATIGNHQRNVGNYKQDIIDAFDEIGVETISYGDRWREVQQATEQTRAKFEAVQKTASGLASGFSALQGVMALTGIENENFEKTMIKVQSAMAIAQGVGGLKDLIEGLSQAKVAFQGATMCVKAFITGLSGMKKALISTGIGALIVAVGTLIAYWEDVVALFDDSEEKIKDVQRASAELDKKIGEQNEAIDYYQRLQEAMGKTRAEVLALTKDKILETTLDAQQALFSLDAKITKESNKQVLEVLKADREKLAKQVDDLTKRLDRINKDIEIHQVELKTQTKKDAEETAKQNAENAKRLAEQRAKQKKDELKQIDDFNEEARLSLLSEKEREIEIETKAYNEQVALFLKHGKNIETIQVAHLVKLQEINDKYAEEEAKQEEERRKKKEDKLIKDLNSELSNNTTSTNQLTKVTESYYDTKALELKDNEIGLVELEIQKTLELSNIRQLAFDEHIRQIQEVLTHSEISAEKRMELEKQITDLQNEKLNLANSTNLQLVKLNNDAVEAQKKKNKELKQNIVNTYTSALSSAQSIISSIQDGIDTDTKEGFERNKKLQVSNATIGMLVGITNALSGAFTTKSGPWDLILAGIQASAIATSGAIQIANINKQKYDGSGGDSNVSVTPNVNLSDSMPIQYTRELMTDTETTEMNKSTRVYVLESDISETQENVSVKEANATF